MSMTLKKTLLIIISVLASSLLCEVSIHLLPVELLKDILRGYYADTRIRKKSRIPCAFHDGLSLLDPRFAFTSPSPNLLMRYTAGVLKIRDCYHGYRLNGWGDDLPVYGVVLGDSHTENVHMDDREGWVSLLSRKSGKRFVNLGCWGKGTSYHSRIAKAFLPALKPKVVILQVSTNDWSDDIREKFPDEYDRLEQKARAPSGEKTHKKPVYRFLDATQKGFLKNTVFLHVFRSVAGAFIDKITPGTKPVDLSGLLSRTEGLEIDNVVSMLEIVKNINAHFYIVSMDGEKYLEDTGIRKSAQKNNIPITILTWNKLYISHIYSHNNAKGNQRLANEVFDFLTELKEL